MLPLLIIMERQITMKFPDMSKLECQCTWPVKIEYHAEFMMGISFQKYVYIGMLRCKMDEKYIYLTLIIYDVLDVFSTKNMSVKGIHVDIEKYWNTILLLCRTIINGKTAWYNIKCNNL